MSSGGWEAYLYGFFNEVLAPFFWLLYLLPALICAVPVLIYIVVKVIQELRKK